MKGTTSALTATNRSGLLQILPATLEKCEKSLDTMAQCDTGSIISFVDKESKAKLGAQGKCLTINITSHNGTEDVLTEMELVVNEALYSRK